MLIHEVSKLTKLTKKAIEYYTLQGLISPLVLGNGYREYSSQDIERLHKIRTLRMLDISTGEIKQILNDKTGSALQAVSVKKELDHQRDVIKKSALEKLIEGKPYEELNAELESIEQGKSITDKLLDAFPGYFGRFICMHFARFLNEPILSAAQQSAYEAILSFLDHIPTLDIPRDLENYMIEGTGHIGTKQISEILEKVKASYENPDVFLMNNAELLAQYLQFKKSEEYKNSPACKWLKLLTKFNSISGYNDVFIPAMKQLSVSYAEYFRQMEIASEKLLAQYPEIETLNE